MGAQLAQQQTAGLHRGIFAASRRRAAPTPSPFCFLVVKLSSSSSSGASPGVDWLGASFPGFPLLGVPTCILAGAALHYRSLGALVEAVTAWRGQPCVSSSNRRWESSVEAGGWC